MTVQGARSGTSLIEIVIVLAMMSLIAAVCTVSLRALREPPPHTLCGDIADSLRRAAATGLPRFVSSADSSMAFVLYDGRVFADSVFHVDLLTGRPSRSR